MWENHDPGWYAQRENIKKVVFDASFANRKTNELLSLVLWLQ